MTEFLLNHRAQATPRIAPLWHTLVLVVCILYPRHLSLRAAFLGFNLQTKLVTYAVTAGVQWLLVLFLLIGLHLRRRSLWTLIGNKEAKSHSFSSDFLVALLFSFVVIVCGVSFYMLLGSPRLEHQTIADMPTTFPELLAWIPLAVSTGVVEELIFRGYLFQQALAYFGRPAPAICIQAVLFSAGHGFQQTLVGYFHKFILGLLFGGLTYYRKSLSPAMISHSIFDVLAGVTSFL